jgi:hypothetical protein
MLQTQVLVQWRNLGSAFSCEKKVIIITEQARVLIVTSKNMLKLFLSKVLQ